VKYLLQLIDWWGLHQYHAMQGSRISNFDIRRGDVMVEQRTKSASKKVAAAKTKTKTKASSAISGKPKTAKAAVTSSAKKVVAKKTSAAAAKPKKTKPAAVKKVSSPAAKIKTPTKQTTSVKKAAAKPTLEERYRMVETAAYYIAEKHGFQGRSDEHWAAAERAIAAKWGQ
jgi:hypothetical protein